MTRPIVVVEIDLPVCSLTYGTAPCTAAVGVTGDIKCFNTSRTCQDRANFATSSLTVRFAEPFAEMDFDALPALDSVSVTPNKLDPGRSIGVRASVKVSIADFQFSDAGLDPYLADRAYDPFTQGTYWGKMRARIPSMEGFPLRVLRGYVGDSLDAMRVEHYVIDTAVSDAQGITITAKDPLAFCEAKKSQAPALSTGRLLLARDTDDTAVTLTPTGVGDLEYPASGFVCLSGKEVCAFTRSGDNMTLVRDYLGTGPKSHEADALVQLCLVYDGEAVGDIVYDLLVNYTEGVDPAWADLPAWQAEASSYVGHLYHRIVPAPTEVSQLVNELLEQAGCSVWWDLEGQAIRFQSLRPVLPDASLYDDDIIEAGSLVVKEQPGSRVSQAWTYYGIIDPTDKAAKEENFAMAVLRLDDSRELEYTLPAIRKTMSRWINSINRPAAERLNAMLLSRYVDAPRDLSFRLHAEVTNKPVLGTGIRIQSSQFQDATGASTVVNAYVVSVEPGHDYYSYEAQELNFADVAPDNEKTIYIDTDRFNVVLRDLYDSLYEEPPADLILHVRLAPGVYIGSTDGSPSFTVGDTGDWPGGAVIHIWADASTNGIVGYGGWAAGYGFDVAEDGGTALHVRRAITLHLAGLLAGGGGGGGRLVATSPYFQFAGGGGGAGFNFLDGTLRRGGQGGSYGGSQGSAAAGGPGGSLYVDGGEAYAGDGGGLGQVGETPYATPGTTSSPGGDAGPAVDGHSFVTYDSSGTILGAQIN
jgi:hypothetical protein